MCIFKNRKFIYALYNFYKVLQELDLDRVCETCEISKDDPLRYTLHDQMIELKKLLKSIKEEAVFFLGKNGKKNRE